MSPGSDSRMRLPIRARRAGLVAAVVAIPVALACRFALVHRDGDPLTAPGDEPGDAGSIARLFRRLAPAP
jgi:hypothetical protein